MQLSRILKTAIGTVDGEAWLRFFLAVAGLGLAFLAAIYSTAVRDAGHITASIVLAMTALLLAGGVGITLGPYLARGVAGVRVRGAPRFSGAGEGMGFLGVALGIRGGPPHTPHKLPFLLL